MLTKTKIYYVNSFKCTDKATALVQVLREADYNQHITLLKDPKYKTSINHACKNTKQNPLVDAAFLGHLETAKYILNNFLNLTEKTLTLALHRAVDAVQYTYLGNYKKHYEDRADRCLKIINLLLKKGANPNALFDSGITRETLIQSHVNSSLNREISENVLQLLIKHNACISIGNLLVDTRYKQDEWIEKIIIITNDAHKLGLCTEQQKKLHKCISALSNKTANFIQITEAVGIHQLIVLGATSMIKLTEYINLVKNSNSNSKRNNNLDFYTKHYQHCLESCQPSNSLPTILNSKEVKNIINVFLVLSVQKSRVNLLPDEITFYILCQLGNLIICDSKPDNKISLAMELSRRSNIFDSIITLHNNGKAEEEDNRLSNEQQHDDKCSIM